MLALGILGTSPGIVYIQCVKGLFSYCQMGRIDRLIHVGYQVASRYIDRGEAVYLFLDDQRLKTNLWPLLKSQRGGALYRAR